MFLPCSRTGPFEATPRRRLIRALTRNADYAHGEAQTISPQVREVTGVEPRDLRQFAKDYAGAFMPLPEPPSVQPLFVDMSARK
jgi:hypothetical protein